MRGNHSVTDEWRRRSLLGSGPLRELPAGYLKGGISIYQRVVGHRLWRADSGRSRDRWRSNREVWPEAAVQPRMRWPKAQERPSGPFRTRDYAMVRLRAFG